MVEMQLQVGHVDGTSLCPKGVVKVMLEINTKQFEHMFIMCQNLKQPLLFCMNFAENYRIGIDWDHNGVSHLRYKGRKLISAWPNGSISDPDHVTRKIIHVIDMSVDSMTNKPGIRLKTSIVVSIAPHNIAIMPLEHQLEFYNTRVSIQSYLKS